MYCCLTLLQPPLSGRLPRPAIVRWQLSNARPFTDLCFVHISWSPSSLRLRITPTSALLVHCLNHSPSRPSATSAPPSGRTTLHSPATGLFQQVTLLVQTEGSRPKNNAVRLTVRVDPPPLPRCFFCSKTPCFKPFLVYF